MKRQWVAQLWIGRCRGWEDNDETLTSNEVGASRPVGSGDGLWHRKEDDSAGYIGDGKDHGGLELARGHRAMSRVGGCMVINGSSIQ